ncbi:hypothetical protein NL676_021455 [Syzygium grande]|nr:hypothetical protein NL676_021455 [Syzygium grande]
MSWEAMTGNFGWGSNSMEEMWRKGPWTAEEDKLLIEHVKLHGEGRWNSVARLTGLKRNGKSCRLRWVNYLRPDLKKGQITPLEESIILELHARWGNRWSTIARSLPGRTDNEIKNYWRTHFKNKAKASPSNPGRLKAARLLRRQQFHHHQQQQQQQHQQMQQQQQQQLPQQQQQLQLTPVDMKSILSLLEETDHHRVLYAPPIRPEIAEAYPNNSVYDQCLFYSVSNANNASLPEASSSTSTNEDILWDGLWSMEDVHGINCGAPYATGKATMHNLVAPFC